MAHIIHPSFLLHAAMQRRRRALPALGVIVLLLALLAGCAPADSGAPPAAGDGRLMVLATTTIIGDVVRQVAGDAADVRVLLSPGTEPHTYEPTPSEMAAVHDADVLFANGAGLETWLDDMVRNAGGDARIVLLAEGIDLLEAVHTGEEEEEEDEGHAEGEFDPHVWFSVPNVVHWVGTIEATLVELDAGNAEAYRANADAYRAELQELDDWIQEQVATIPAENRKLVTNHTVFTYFSERYGLEQVGTIYPVGPASEPSAREISALQDAIREYEVPAVFTESTVNARLAEQVAQDTGVEILSLYTDSLGPAGSGAETYLDLMRYDVTTIVEGLSQ